MTDERNLTGLASDASEDDDEGGSLFEVEELSPDALQDYFDDALETFPYKFEQSGLEMGDLNYRRGEVEYGLEIIFKVGDLFGVPLYAGGWVELRGERGEMPTISGFFAIVRDQDWKKGHILKEFEALLGTYDISTYKWSLEIGMY